MTDERDVAAVFNEGLAPVLDEAPPAPAWESLQYDFGPPSHRIGSGWLAAVAAAVVILVGVGSILLLGRVGSSDRGEPGDSATPPSDAAAGGSIEGRWVLESWEEDGKQIPVKIGVNTTGEVFLVFTAAPDSGGTVGTFTGSTGCNGIVLANYHYSAGFLDLGQMDTTAMGCDPDTAERVLRAMVVNNPAGIEVVMDGDTMEWYGRNAVSTWSPLTLRRTDSASSESTSTTTLSTTTSSAVPGGPGAIEGHWIFASWQEGNDEIRIEPGVNADDEPWLEFAVDEVTSAGVAGTFEGSTGCNAIWPTDFEYSAGFLTHGEVVATAGGCGRDTAQSVLLAVLRNTPDGIEVVMDGDTMEWYGSNLEGASHPVTFRREGAPVEPTTTTVAEPNANPDMRVYEVEGVEVVTPTRLDNLPAQATHVEVTTTVIDSGDGPELCLGAVMDSLPPQCSGPVANGLDMEGWTEEASGVRWGEQTLVVTWPPVDGAVEVISQSEASYLDLGLRYPPGELPAECQGVATGAGAGPINQYASSLGDANGGLYVANDGTLVLQVVGDPAPHREALAASGGACVIEVSRSEAEQRRIQDSIVPLLRDIPEIGGSYAVATGPGGRVEVQVPVADRSLAQTIAGLVDDPTAIRLVGRGILLP